MSTSGLRLAARGGLGVRLEHERAAKVLRQHPAELVGGGKAAERKEFGVVLTIREFAHSGNRVAVKVDRGRAS